MIQAQRPAVYLADATRIFRDALVVVLNQAGYNVVGSGSSSDDIGRAFISGPRPEIVIMDSALTGSDPLDCAVGIKRKHPNTKFIFLSSEGDVERVNTAMEAGISAYVLKTSPLPDLIEAMRVVQAGNTYLTASLVAPVIRSAREGRCSRSRSLLTPRQRSVLKMLAEGSTVKDIAQLYSLSVKTVQSHKFTLMQRLGMRNRTQLVVYAIQKGIISVPESKAV
jgi:two-component system response regulator NreC